MTKVSALSYVSAFGSVVTNTIGNSDPSGANDQEPMEKSSKDDESRSTVLGALMSNNSAKPLTQARFERKLADDLKEVQWAEQKARSFIDNMRHQAIKEDEQYKAEKSQVRVKQESKK